MTDIYTPLSDQDLVTIRNEFNILHVPFLTIDTVNHELISNKQFNNTEKNTIKNMSNYYFTHKNKHIHKTTDYLCDMQTKVCICNKNAENLRKLTNKAKYNIGETYVSWYPTSET